MAEDIRYLLRKEIDDVRWNSCIEAASNGLIYAFTYYLDHMADNWDGLVMGDYEFVMPVTWNRKYGISYMYQPAFTPMLGIFGQAPNKQVVDLFLSSIPRRFKVIEIALNHQNKLLTGNDQFIMRNNFVLDLRPDYVRLAAGYRENIKRNIRKAEKFEVQFRSDINVEEVLELAREQLAGMTNLGGKDYEKVSELYQFLRQRNEAASYGVYSPRGQLLASALFFFSHGRAYYIVVGNHPDSRTYGASHFLLDRFIRLYSTKDILLDFEGSDIKNLAFFYESFGSHAEVYPSLKINRLPAVLKLFKK